MQFVSALATLDSCIEDILFQHPDLQVFIRGDANVNPKNASRSSLFLHFLSKNSILKVNLEHPTYHHFLGQGAFDSPLDVILHSNSPLISESVSDIICKLQNPLVQSHHDIIISEFCLAAIETPVPAVNPEAPKADNTRIKIFWSDEGIAHYEEIVADNLTRLRDTWCDPSSPASMSILLSSTYSLLSSSAKLTNNFTNLSDPIKTKPRHHPNINALQKDLLAQHKSILACSSFPNQTPSAILEANMKYLKLKNMYRQEIRKEQRDDSIKRDENLNNILTNNPTSVHRSIKGFKNSNTNKIHTLHVNDATYVGKAVPDGFFASLSALKSPDMSSIHSTPQYQNTLADYNHILKICRAGDPIPDISPKTSTEILLSMKANVNDYFSITANHFMNAGRAGFSHFHFLLSALIKNVNLAGLDELNNVWACILYKGHGKDKNSDRSYRTISTCPIIAKALDTYVGQLYGEGWAEAQAPTQFQGSGSSHELAALLLTETILHSLHVTKLPLYILLLDAKAAYDKIVRECAIRNAYLARTNGHGLLYINSRLENRKTFVEYDKTLMGPIRDSLGVEQGGVNSDRIYKLCNNVQLSTAQNSGLGANIGSTVLSSSGFADDTKLASNSLSKVGCLLHLTNEYCKDYHVDLVAEKTKLLAFVPPGQELEVYYQSLTSPLYLNGHKINFSSSAEHLGVLRSVDGNMPNILSRISAHTRALMSILPTGMAHCHRGNPAASLRLEKLYGTPVLLSGLASLVLNVSEASAIHQHHKLNLQRLQRLHQATPECVVMFLGGSLPATGILHLKMFSLLGMIARLGPQNILHQHAIYVLLSPPPNCKSWFLSVRLLTQQYALQDPIIILQSPPTQCQWKSQCRSKVIDWYEKKLRAQADLLPSLQFFKPNFMSLKTPHPLWTHAGSPYEIGKAVITARMLSGRYRTDQLTRHWTLSNPEGHCRLPGCTNNIGNLHHILLKCPALAESRARMISLWSSFMVSRPLLLPIIQHYTIDQDNMMLQFLLDPSCLPLVISTNRSAPDTLQHCLYLSRTWCYSTHLARSRLLRELNLS